MTNVIGDVRLFAEITDTKTGLAVKCELREGLAEDVGLVIFDWLENNNSCDCNRSIHFENAGGETDYDGECGDGRFFVRLLNEDGSLIAADERAPDLTNHPDRIKVITT